MTPDFGAFGLGMKFGEPSIGAVRGLKVPGFKIPGAKGGVAPRQKIGKYLLRCAKEEGTSAGDIIEIDGMLGIKAEEAIRWIKAGLSNFCWEGIYAGDPVPINGSRVLPTSLDWEINGIPWEQAVKHAKVAIVQEWTRQQPAGYSNPGNPLWAQNEYSDMLWKNEASGFPAKKFEVGWIGFIPGEFPIIHGRRERPRLRFDGDAPGNRVQIPHGGIESSLWWFEKIYYGAIEEAEGIIKGDLMWEWRDGVSLGTTPARDIKGAWVNGWGGSNREHPEVEYDQPMDMWQEIKCAWEPEEREFPELYIVKRDDFNYQWASTHPWCWIGEDASLPFGYRFPLSLGMEGLPHLDADSRGWIIWGVQSFPGFAINDHRGSKTVEGTANDWPEKYTSELQMRPITPGTVSAGIPTSGAVLLDRV